MSHVRERIRTARFAAISAATSGGSQNFLGAPWVSAVVEHAPVPVRRRVSLRLVSLSPHYFFSRDLRAEDSRCRSQRELLTEQLLSPYLSAETVALDYGCGPGYMAAAVARRAGSVEAVDISRGALACAATLNPALNITYETSGQAAARDDQVDLAYSFAVVQHLTDDVFRTVLAVLKRRIRPGGTLILHFALPIQGWRTEDQWRADSSVQGRAKLRFGLNCFGRGEHDVARLVMDAGFGNIHIEPLADKTNADSEIAAQHWLVAIA